MPITHVASSSSNSKDITTQAVPKPTGIQVGDALYVWLATNGGSGVIITPPAGWTELTTGPGLVDTDAGATEKAYLYRKIATSTETAASTFDFEFAVSSNRQSAFGCTALRGVDQTTPEDASIQTVAPSVSSSTPDPPSITTVTDGAWVLAFMAQESNDTGITMPSGYTESWQDTSLGDVPAESTTGAVAYKEVVSAGVEDPGVFTATTNDGYVAATIAVRPAANSSSNVAASITDRAELLLRAQNYSGSGDWLDESGNGHDAQLGSLAGADTNDPLFLPYDGQYMYTPGVIGNYVSCVHHADMNTTDLDLRAYIAMDDWTTPPVQTSILDRSPIDPNRMFRWSMKATGVFDLTWYPTGSAASAMTESSTVANGITDGEWSWVRATLDVDNGAGGYDVKFWKSTDGSTWDQIGATVTGGAPTNLPTVTAPWLTQGNTPLAGKWRRALQMNAIDGVPVVDINFTKEGDLAEPFATFTEKVNGLTVTVFRTASGRVSTVVDRDLFLLGTDDYFEVADAAGLDFGTGDSLTVLVVGRIFNDPAAEIPFIAKKLGAGDANIGWMLGILPGDRWPLSRISDGTNGVFDQKTTTIGLGETFIAGMIRDVAGDDLTSSLDGSISTSPATDTTTTTLANAEVVRVGRLSGGSGAFADLEIHSVALWREALTDAEVYAAGRELLFTGFKGDILGTLKSVNHRGGSEILANLRLDGATSNEVVGALNQLNGTTNVEFRKAYHTYIGAPL